MIIAESAGLNLGSSRALLFADCAVIPDPTAEELAGIARATAENARAIPDVEAACRVAFFFHQGVGETCAS